MNLRNERTSLKYIANVSDKKKNILVLKTCSIQRCCCVCYLCCSLRGKKIRGIIFKESPYRYGGIFRASFYIYWKVVRSTHFLKADQITKCHNYILELLLGRAVYFSRVIPKDLEFSVGWVQYVSIMRRTENFLELVRILMPLWGKIFRSHLKNYGDLINKMKCTYMHTHQQNENVHTYTHIPE